MWKNRFRKGVNNNNNNDDNGDDQATKESGSAAGDDATGRPSSAAPLPDKTERLALYRILKAVVEKRCEGYATLTDPRSLGVKSFFRSGKNVPPITSLGIRKRQLDYLRLHVLPTLAAALLLEIEDIQEPEQNLVVGAADSAETTLASKKEGEANAATSSFAETKTEDGEEKTAATAASTPELSDPVACITLLMSNMILVSKGNYDARVRNILKTACVPLLEKMMTEEEERNDDRNKARALYFLTEQHTKQEKKKDDKRKKPLEERLNDSLDGSSHEQTEDGNKTRTGLYFWRKPTSQSLEDNNGDDKNNGDEGEKDDKQDDSGEQNDRPVIENEMDDDMVETGDEQSGDIKQKKPEEEKYTSVDEQMIEREKEERNKLADKQPDPEDESLESAIESSGEDAEKDGNGDSKERTLDEQGRKGEGERFRGLTFWKKSPSKGADEEDGNEISGGQDVEDKLRDQRKPRSLYFWKKSAEPSADELDKKDKSETSDEQDEEEGNEESEVIDWERTTRIPKLSRGRVATQQFEAIERAIATDILKELVERDQAAMQHTKKASTWKDNVVRGLKITTVSVVVGSLFAVTGGLAAPGLVAAIAALGVHSTAVFAALTTTTALASMFGVVGGGLGAYRMSKRVQGLSEWRIRKETTSTTESGSNKENDAVKLRGLHSHVCVSGWLAEKCDFQRPFGVKCQDPIMPPLRALQRFFCVHDPERVKDAAEMLKETDEKELWPQLKEQYGKTPDDLLPLQGESAPVLSEDFCTGINNVLMQHVLPEDAVGKMKAIWETNTMLIQMVAKNDELLHTASFISDDVYEDEEEQEKVQALKEEALRVATSPDSTGKDKNIRGETSDVTGDAEDQEAADGHDANATEGGRIESNSEQSRIASDPDGQSRESVTSTEENNPAGSTAKEGEAPSNTDKEGSGQGDEVEGAESGNMDETGDNEDNNVEKQVEESGDGDKKQEDNAKAETMDDYLEIIWDWQATYSGEMYTLSWETNFLLKLCRVATVLFMEMSDVVGKQVLTNVLVGSVVAIPSALWTASMVIDDPYQVISLRSKTAGIELAQCLLTSDEHRPISLVGFSFGARLIFDCLLELARHQLLWQEQQKQLQNADNEDTNKGRSFIRSRRSVDVEKIDYVREPASIVEDVILIGMPRTMDKEEWITCREVVGGRLVNCYNRKDWIVSYMINVRCFGAINKTCGTHAVETMEGIENYEVSDFASTHDKYLAAVPQILQKVGYSQPTSAL